MLRRSLWGTGTACSGGSTTTATSPTPSSSTAVVKDFPKSAHYIADMPMAGGKTMTIGVAVEGDKIAAYACDGSTDEAWFFGTQKDGSLDITSRYQDTLKASFDGSAVVGQLNMNDVNYTFTAASVPSPSGMYTAEANGVRASWVVRPDNTITGVQFKKSKRLRYRRPGGRPMSRNSATRCASGAWPGSCRPPRRWSSAPGARRSTASR